MYGERRHIKQRSRYVSLPPFHIRITCTRTTYGTVADLPANTQFAPDHDGILSAPNTSPTERVLTRDLIYSHAMHMAKELSSAHPEEVVADIKTISDRLGLRPSAVRTAYEALAERGAVRIDERILPKPRHQLSLPLDRGTSEDTRRK